MTTFTIQIFNCGNTCKGQLSAKLFKEKYIQEKIHIIKFCDIFNNTNFCTDHEIFVPGTSTQKIQAGLLETSNLSFNEMVVLQHPVHTNVIHLRHQHTEIHKAH